MDLARRRATPLLLKFQNRPTGRYLTWLDDEVFGDGMRQQDDIHKRAAVTLKDPRWAAVLTRDRQMDGRFVYAVKTTGVYCRPSCAARFPRPENVVFHAGLKEAEAAGFRPCKRCKPEQASLEEQQALKIAEACRSIENASEEPALQELADAAEMSVRHFHRVFRTLLGLTPKQYAVAHRGKSVRRQLVRSETVTRAVYDAGFNSSGRFYANSNKTLGMTPSAFRRGGEGVGIGFAIGKSTLGSVLVAQSQRGICAILLGDDPQQLVCDLERSFPLATLIGDAELEELVAKVVGLVEVPGGNFDLPLDIRGTAFQQRVWQALRGLPSGSTMTYKELAVTIGMPRSVRAVAQACAANCLAVAVPCHRVIRSDGGTSGYRWGVERKKLLLQRESSQTADANRRADSAHSKAE